MMVCKLGLMLCALLAMFNVGAGEEGAIEYKLLATNRTSTMQKEMNTAADAGFHFAGVTSGNTTFGGSEVVAIMARPSGENKARYAYKLVGTRLTSTMQKELQEAGNDGFEYRGQIMFEPLLGGKEIAVILELDRERKEKQRWEYKLLATTKTSTMQKELTEAGAQGFEVVGVTVGNTASGGPEVVSILRRRMK